MNSDSDDDYGPYKTAADIRTLRAIREFMKTENAILRMTVATELERPAVEALSGPLLARFEKDLTGPKRDALKKFIGWNARRILEKHDFRIDQQNCLVRTGNLFTRATRYIRK